MQFYFYDSSNKKTMSMSMMFIFLFIFLFNTKCTRENERFASGCEFILSSHTRQGLVS